MSVRATSALLLGGAKALRLGCDFSVSFFPILTCEGLQERPGREGPLRSPAETSGTWGPAAGKAGGALIAGPPATVPGGLWSAWQDWGRSGVTASLVPVSVSWRLRPRPLDEMPGKASSQRRAGEE